MGKRIEKMRAELFVALVGRFSGGKVAIFTHRASFFGRSAPFSALARREGGRKEESRGR